MPNAHEISPDARPITLHPRNVARLNGNATAAYLMQYLIQQCDNGGATFADFDFVPKKLSISQIMQDTGLSWDRITSSVKVLENRDFLTTKGAFYTTTVPIEFLPNLRKLTGAER